MNIFSKIGFAVVLLGIGPFAAHAGLVVTIDAPGIQSSQVAGVTTEDFNSFAVGIQTTLNSSIGTYTSTGEAIVAPNQYGGSNNTDYFAIGAQSGTLSATLTLNSSQAYFGMEWLAGDAQNILDFYSHGNLIAEFSTASAFAATTHSGGPFGNGDYGNPNTNQDSGEPFGYLNFYATGSTTFDQIVFRNQSTGSGFESDNHSVRGTVVDPPYDGTVISTNIAATPEPASMVTAICAVALTSVQAWRKRRHAVLPMA